MPVYNEPQWVEIAALDAARAAVASGFDDLEMIIVDDGSDDETRSVLRNLTLPVPLRILHQENRGRFRAREAGIRAASGTLILLIDSRVSIDENALRFVREQLGAGQGQGPWNGHVNVLVAGNPYARFWNVITEISFAAYFENPRTTSFGVEEFDHFPKGTTCFLAEKGDLLWAIEQFQSHFDDPAMANDDTNLIRILATKARINISPHFSCTYRGRQGLRPFLRHAHHRGIVFVDGFLRPGTRFLPALVAFFPASMGVAVWATRRARRLLAVPLLAASAFAAIGLVKRRTPTEIRALTLLGPPWLIAYSLGIWRGLLMAIRHRNR